MHAEADGPARDRPTQHPLRAEPSVSSRHLPIPRARALSELRRRRGFRARQDHARPTPTRETDVTRTETDEAARNRPAQRPPHATTSASPRPARRPTQPRQTDKTARYRPRTLRPTSLHETAQHSIHLTQERRPHAEPSVSRQAAGLKPGSRPHAKTPVSYRVSGPRGLRRWAWGRSRTARDPPHRRRPR